MRGLATAYIGLDRRDEAIVLYRELLDLELAPAEAGDADANTVRAAAWTLVVQELPELRQPDRALDLAERAHAMAVEDGEANLVPYLDTLAFAQFRAARGVEAVATGRRALELAPEDTQLRNRLIAYEAALARAREMMSALVQRRVAAAEAPGADAGALNEAAWLLVTAGTAASFLAEFRDPPRALAFAERACAMVEATGSDELWSFLVTLALAQHRTGDTASAVATHRRALELMPDDADPELADRLAECEAALEAEPRTRTGNERGADGEAA
jgi:tetratricopeptide (TPR) repeat protein